MLDERRAPASRRRRRSRSTCICEPDNGHVFPFFHLRCKYRRPCIRVAQTRNRLVQAARKVVGPYDRSDGRVAERFKAPVLKTGSGATHSWVRIPPLPPTPASISGDTASGPTRAAAGPNSCPGAQPHADLTRGPRISRDLRDRRRRLRKASSTAGCYGRFMHGSNRCEPGESMQLRSLRLLEFQCRRGA